MKEIKRLLGLRIKELRKNKNLTQEQLAEIAHIDFRSLSHIECGDTFPTKSLVDIANAFNITISELLDFEHVKYSIQEMKEYIQKNLDNIPEQEIVTLFRFIKAMK